MARRRRLKRDVKLRPDDLRPSGSPIHEPKRQECLGRYLYGSGFYESEDTRAAIVQAAHSVSFCHECPKMQQCFDEHVRQVRAEHPEESELFAQQLRAGARRGLSEETVQMVRAKQGNPDPYLRRALDNFRQGMADRERRQ